MGGFDLGLEQAGHQVVWQAESDPWRRRVLAEHWPGVPCYPDVRGDALGTDTRPVGCDRLNAGRSTPPLISSAAVFHAKTSASPDNDAGLAGSRSGLFHEFARIIDAVRPSCVLIENVPGLLSSNGGRDFGVVLGTLADARVRRGMADSRQPLLRSAPAPTPRVHTRRRHSGTSWSRARRRGTRCRPGLRRASSDGRRSGDASYPSI